MIKSVNIITLGCSKNLVDSEYLMFLLDKNGIKVAHDSNSPADLVVINTCGFILDAKNESISTIFEWIEQKKKGKVKKIYVFGCLTERYKDDIKGELPEVDGIFGTDSFQEIMKSLNLEISEQSRNKRYTTTPSHYAYLKIAEGCDRICSFCAIPQFRGKFRSRPIFDLVQEAAFLAKKGVKELILIAQDLSYYGIDISKKPMLARLIRELSKVKGIEWIRMHYLYPSGLTEELIQEAKTNPKLCPYFDMPIQHVSDKVLIMMRRMDSKKNILYWMDKIRAEIPGAAIRTTLLVGHPGEGEGEFNELVEFVKDYQFDRLGVFTYSEEENTFGAKNYQDDVPENIKQQRHDTIMEIQHDISWQKNQEKIGSTTRVLVDRLEGDFYIGRSPQDSPEVDNEILVKKVHELNPGKFYDVKITGATEFDLFAEPVNILQEKQ